MFTGIRLFGLMSEHDASDLYLTVGRPPSFRINGQVINVGEEITTEEHMQVMLEELLDDKQNASFLETKELNFALFYENIGRFRVNVYRQKSRAAMVIRKIETEIMSIDDLRLPPVLKSVSMAKRGLVLVVGATGSGKSTSLAAMIDHRNENEAGHIVTIEDPIEFVHDHKQCVISQREVGTDTDSFKAALKNTLRQAPTAILIGEIRDEQTMEYAINFAETGHLCLATLHANNANQAIERIINFFPTERHKQIYYQLSLNIKGIISQRLLKASDGGRVAAIEVLLSSSRVRDLIKQGDIEGLKEALAMGEAHGMQSFDHALFKLYESRRITEQEALENADSVIDLKLKLRLKDSIGEELEDEDKEEKKSELSLEFSEDEDNPANDAWSPNPFANGSPE